MKKGFTIIELVIVIAILGILAAVALPKFVDLTGQADTAAVQGIAGSISSGSATNFAAKKAGASGAITVNAANVCTTTVLQDFLQGTQFPANYTTSGTGDCSGTNDSVSCTISKVGGTATATAAVYCAR